MKGNISAGVSRLMDSIENLCGAVDEQQRASNGQFGSGGGKSQRASSPAASSQEVENSKQRISQHKEDIKNKEAAIKERGPSKRLSMEIGVHKSEIARHEANIKKHTK